MHLSPRTRPGEATRIRPPPTTNPVPDTGPLPAKSEQILLPPCPGMPSPQHEWKRKQTPTTMKTSSGTEIHSRHRRQQPERTSHHHRESSVARPASFDRQNAEKGRGRGSHRRQHRQRQRGLQSSITGKSSNADRERIPRDTSALPPHPKNTSSSPSS